MSDQQGNTGDEAQQEPTRVEESTTTVEETKTDFPDAGRDKEIEAERQAAFDRDNAEHLRRTAGGDPEE